MATLPGLVLKIGANTTDAIAGLNKVNRAVGQSATGADKMRASWRKAGPALAAAGAAVGVLAVKLGVDAVQAAMAEEAELTKLNRTLGNLGFGDASAQVNDFIDDMQFATGVADSDLRPAFDRLVRSTGSVAEAQRVLGIALDTSVGTGRSLQSVAEALGKAYDGNTTGLSRLGAGLDKATLKTGDMQIITGELAKTFDGQAAAAADTLAGRMAILRIGMDELQESFGAGLIEGFMDGLADGSDNIDDVTERLRDNQATLNTWGKTIGDILASAIGWLDDFGLGAMKVADTFDDAASLMIRGYVNLADTLGWMSDAQAEAIRTNLDAADAQREAAMQAYALGAATDDTTSAQERGSAATGVYRRGLESMTGETKRAETALQKLQRQMDKMSTNRSIAGQRINLAQARAEGPGKGDNLREFGLGYADQAARLASDIAERGNFSERSKRRARRVLSNAREYLGGLGLGSNFTDADGAFLGTPNALRAGSRNSRAAGRVTDESQKMGTTVKIDTVNVYADTPEEAVEKAKRFARMSAAGRGLPMRGTTGLPNSALNPGPSGGVQ